MVKPNQRCSECNQPLVIVNGWATCPDGHGKLRIAGFAPEGAKEYKSCRNLNKFADGLKQLESLDKKDDAAQ